MLDFMEVRSRPTKRGVFEIYPSFLIKKSTDLMIRGRDFYAIWVADKGLWSTDEQDAVRLIDLELDDYVKKNENTFNGSIHVLRMRDAQSGMIDAWHKYCQKQTRDSFHMLDEKLIFSNYETKKEDYASKKLNYPLEEGDTPAWDRLMSVLYSAEERKKIEWAIGSIVTGDSRKIQKFMVFYGSSGTGKSTVLNIIQQLFDGYTSVFDAKALGSSSNSFALESFRKNPLVAIQHDGDLSKIEDNTRLNSLVSHEWMTVNEKFKASYENRFKSFLFMGTNRPVKITDAKSGLIRRLIDVSPTGDKIPPMEYTAVMQQITFELGKIASKCKNVYISNPGAYDDYVPTKMLGASNDFYNFIIDSWYVFGKEGDTTLKTAWEMYKTYCEDAKVMYMYPQRTFKEELKNYFDDYFERITLEDGTRVRNYYSGFKKDIFDNGDEKKEEVYSGWIVFSQEKSVADEAYRECPAQYASSRDTPTKPWDDVSTLLKDLDTSRTHFVLLPENHIVIDFDLKDENGNKSLAKNLEEANKWPPTYAEVSKSGNGIHLHYLYGGDASKLSRLYDKDIEIKVFLGKSSLRRKLTKCNQLEIGKIETGLPVREVRDTIAEKTIKNENHLRVMIGKNLRKEIYPNTKPSIDFIHKLLSEAYENGIEYDVSDMRNAIVSFASKSTNQSDYCLKLVGKMKFKSEETDILDESQSYEERPIVFFDAEVFPNLFLVNWKLAGEGKKIVRMINPTAKDIEKLIKYRLIGFNCRRYDNHILYGRLIGYSVRELFDLSQRIINKDRNSFFGKAYNISYTDIYDFASAQNKKSLKKLEIEMGIHHQELGLPWDEPVDESLWPKVSEYCDNDVIAAEAAFHYLSADWTARKILADIAGMTVNNTTNELSARIVFGNNRNPQSEFEYRNLAEPVLAISDVKFNFLSMVAPEMMAQRHGEANSYLPYFPGYKFEKGKSTYKGEEIGEGGRVCAEPGMYADVALLDVYSMHPFSMICEMLFGERYTKNFYELVIGRGSVKHEAWSELDHILGGKLLQYTELIEKGEITAKDLANALKTAINSAYGNTAASFDNVYRDKRNIDNIVAKRGALFMTDLKEEVIKKGYTVAHIKTDSIKIPNADSEIINFVIEFGKKYGYTFEHEATYDRMCLVNNSVYIAKFATEDHCKFLYGNSIPIPKENMKHGGEWTATGAQFAVPYVYKTLFSKEKVEFKDFCETKSTTTAIYLDLNEGMAEGEHNYHFVGKVGLFTPVLPGTGGGLLLRSSGEGKYAYLSGATGYRWMESEMISNLGKEDKIDISYYKKLAEDAIDSISEYGDFEIFVSDEAWHDENDVPF